MSRFALAAIVLAVFTISGETKKRPRGVKSWTPLTPGSKAYEEMSEFRYELGLSGAIYQADDQTVKDKLYRIEYVDSDDDSKTCKATFTVLTGKNPTPVIKDKAVCTALRTVPKKDFPKVIGYLKKQYAKEKDVKTIKLDTPAYFKKLASGFLYVVSFRRGKITCRDIFTVNKKSKTNFIENQCTA